MIAMPWGQTKPPVGYGVDWGDPINTGLLAYWLANESAGATLRNLVGAAPVTFGASTASPIWTPGKFGNTPTFDGVNDFASAAVNLSATAVITLSFSLTLEAVAGADDLAFEYTANYNTTNGFIVDPNDAGAFAFGTHQTPSGLWLDQFTRPSAVVPHHYVLVMKRGLENVAYVDGNLQALTVRTHSSTAVDNFDNSTLFFMSRAGTGLFSAGQLDNVRLYRRALSGSEAKRLYSEPFAGIITPRRRIPAAGGFKPYWASQRSQLIGAGIR